MFCRRAKKKEGGKKRQEEGRKKKREKREREIEREKKGRTNARPRPDWTDWLSATAQLRVLVYTTPALKRRPVTPHSPFSLFLFRFRQPFLVTATAR